MASKTAGDQNWSAVRERAEQFATSPRTSAAIQAVLRDPKLLAGALKDPAGFLASHGVKIPSNLDIELFDREPRTMPGPDWFPFVLEFFNCRTYYVRRCNDQSPPLCRWVEESVCFGLRVVPKGFPRPF